MDIPAKETNRPAGTDPNAKKALPSGEYLIRVAALIALACAGAIHLRHAPVHFREDALYGWFFTVVGMSQLAAALYLFRPQGASFYRLAALANLSIVAIWVVTRTAGPPFGAEAGIRHEVGAPDLTASIFQLVAAAACTLLTFRALRLDGREEPSAWSAKLQSITERDLSLTKTAAITVGLAAAALSLTAWSEVKYRPACEHHDQSFGPFAAIEGHSILHQSIPESVQTIGRPDTVLAGYLMNCGDHPVKIEDVSALSTADEAASLQGFFLTRTKPYGQYQSKPKPIEPETVTIPPDRDSPSYAVLARINPVTEGPFFINALRVPYRAGDARDSQPLATNVAIRVIGGTG